jgi:hypothetical protein
MYLMRFVCSLILIITVLFIGCSKEHPVTTVYCHAVTVGPNLDCGVWQIRIGSNLDQVNAMLQASGNLGSNGSTFISANLPDALKTSGLQLLLKVRSPQLPEIGACTAVGSTFPWVFVLSAERMRQQ